MAQLSWSADGAARTADLPDDVVSVGSDRSCGIVLPGEGVSPVHCELRRGPEGWRVVDLESRAGTRVNGEFVNSRTLRDWDVIDVGGVPLTFRDAPSAPGPRTVPGTSGAAARAARGAAQAAAPRPAAAPRAARVAAAPAGGEEPAQRRPRRAGRKTDKATTAMLMAAGGLAMVLVIWFIFSSVGSGTPNHRLRVKMSEAELSMDYQGAIDLSAQADQDGSDDWKEIQKIVARCKSALTAREVGRKVELSITEWNRERVWRQSNANADEEFVRRIDEYLTRWAGIESEGTRQAKAARVRIAGTATPAGSAATGDAAWQGVMDDVKLLETDGRFGDAIAAVDRFWEANRSSAPTRISDVEAEKKRLEAAAAKWFDKQLAVAKRYWLDLDDKFNAKRVLENAGKKIGLPGYADRASEEYRNLIATKK